MGGPADGSAATASASAVATADFPDAVGPTSATAGGPSWRGGAGTRARLTPGASTPISRR